MSAPALPDEPRGARPPKLRYSHRAMVDTLVQNPWMSQNELAAMFGRTPAWISTIVNSDAFQQLLEERRAELVDPEVALTLRERFQALTARSLQKLQERVETGPSDALLLKAAELGSRALGFGAAAPQTLAVVTSEERLAALATRLRALQNGTGAMGAGEVIDVPSREVPRA